MSPARCLGLPTRAVAAALTRVWADFGQRVRDLRLKRRWTTVELARRAGVSRGSVYTVERGEAVSVEVASRLAVALGMRLELTLADPRRREAPAAGQRDLVHSAMGELEAERLRGLGRPVRIDEPFQHFHFAGRADVVSWDLDARALLQIENRTQFPDVQESAGGFNVKRAYLGAVLAQRLGVPGWRSETHVMVGLWSAEVLHVLRLRTATFRSVCPDPTDAFEAWWRGDLPPPGRAATLVVLDPLAGGRQRRFVDLETALMARPRYRGYAEAAGALSARGSVRP